MNRCPGKRAPAGREGSTARLAVSPGEPEPAAITLSEHITRKVRGPAAGGSIVTRDASRATGRQRSGATSQHAAGRPGNPARTAEPARAQPSGAGSR
jgi:hypothetical protein